MKATVGGNGVICTRQKWGNLHPGAKPKKRKKYTGVQSVHFYRLLQVDIISKRENSFGYIGRQVNSLTGLSSLIYSPYPGEGNS